MLLEQKDYNDITITDIAKKAGVSRMSYYRTYSSKDDILIQYFDDLFQNCMNDFKQNPDLDPYHFYLRFFDTFHENKTLIHNLQNTNLYEMIMKSTVKPESLCVTAVRWIEKGAIESPEEMARIYVDMKKGR